MPREITIDIDLGRKCARCGHMGALKNGLCLKCATDQVLKRRAGNMPTFTGTLADVHPKAKLTEAGLLREIQIKVEAPYSQDVAEKLLRVLGQQVNVTIEAAQLSIGGTEAANE